MGEIHEEYILERFQVVYSPGCGMLIMNRNKRSMIESSFKEMSSSTKVIIWKGT